MPRIIIVIILSLPRLSIAAIVFRLLLWIRLLPLVPPCVIKALLPHRYRRLTFLPRFRRIIVIIIPPLLSLRTTLVPLPRFLFWTLLHHHLLLVLPCVIKALLSHHCRRLTSLFHFRRIIVMSPFLSLRTLVPLPLLPSNLLLLLPAGTWPISIS